ncbi:MAG: hypothetical protein ACWGQW_12340, partial [bacterium]
MRSVILAIAGFAVTGTVLALDVPLIVTEEEGVARIENPVNSGVPLPRGAVRNVSELRLLDAEGEVVLASIEPRCRWLGDNSLKWVTVHFLTSLPPYGTKKYRLVESRESIPDSPLKVTKGDGTVTVITGPAKFIVSADRFAPFKQVYLRGAGAEGFSDQPGLLAKPTVVLLESRN